MSKEKIRCGKCLTDNWVDPYMTTSCTKCGAPIRGSKARAFWSGAVSLLLAAVMSPVDVQAELLVNPAELVGSGGSKVEAYFGKSSVKYNGTIDGWIGVSGDTDRTYFSAAYSYGITSSIDLYATAAYLIESDDGDGIGFGLGAKGSIDVFSIGGADLGWYAQFLKLDEKDNAVKTDLTEITAGLILKKALSDDLRGYVGLEMALKSDGSGSIEDCERIGFNNVCDSISLDFERKNDMGVKLGLAKDWNRYTLNFNAGLMNETTFMVGLSMPLGGPRTRTVSSVRTSAIEAQTPVEQRPAVDRAPDKPAAVGATVTSPPTFTSSSGSDAIRSAQRKLAERGYNPGTADGILGERTRSALRKFQRNVGLPETGELDPETSKALGI